MRRICLIAVAVLATLAATSLAGAAAVSTPVQVTDDQFAANEMSLGMDPTGRLLMGMWNDWHFNDGCGIWSSTDGGATWAPESFAPGFTAFTNDPAVPGTGPFTIAGDPVVVYNPKSGLFDVVCQSFGVPANKVNLLSTTFDVTKANANDPADSYGLGAWRLPAVAIASGTSPGTQKGSNGKFPGPRGRHGRHGHRLRAPLRPALTSRGRSSTARAGHRSTSPTRTTTGRPGAARSASATPGTSSTRTRHRASAPTGRCTSRSSTARTEEHEKQLRDDRQIDGRRQHVNPCCVAAPIPAPAQSLPNALYRGGTDVTSTVDQRTGKVVVVYNDQTRAAR